MPARSGAELAVPRAGRPRRVRGSRGRCRTGAFWVASCRASPCLAARSGTGERSYHKKAKPGQGDALTCLRFSRFVPGSSFVNSLLIKISLLGSSSLSGHQGLGLPTGLGTWGLLGGIPGAAEGAAGTQDPRTGPQLCPRASPCWPCGFHRLRGVETPSLSSSSPVVSAA